MDATAHRAWHDLPQDLARLISGRLHEAADFVRFHAVCKPWRDTLLLSDSPLCLPWLLAPGGYFRPTIAQFRSIFSETNTTRCAPGTCCRRNGWLASSDGTRTWLLTVGSDKDRPFVPRLVDPFTGAATPLPPLPNELKNCVGCADGVVFPDGTISLWTLHRYKDRFMIWTAVLRPGDKVWTHAQFYDTRWYFADGSIAACHGQDVVLMDGLESNMVRLHVTRIGNHDAVDETLQITKFGLGITRDEQERIEHEDHLCTYLFESRGDLLAVCIREVIPRATNNNGVGSFFPGAFSVSVYELDKEDGGEGGTQLVWARRDGRSLVGGRVLFLGYPTSFAVDAALLGGAVRGGCAYFVLASRRFSDWRGVLKSCCVYRHSFEDGSTTLVEELPTGRGWADDSSMMWFFPRPFGIAPAQGSRERLLQAPIGKNDDRCLGSIIRNPRTALGPYFRMYVGNLPAWVDSSALKLFFMKYGEVADATVICDARTGRSWKFGFVTMATVYPPDDAIALLDEETFYGGQYLRVKSGQKRPEGPFVMPLLAKVKATRRQL